MEGDNFSFAQWRVFSSEKFWFYGVLSPQPPSSSSLHPSLPSHFFQLFCLLNGLSSSCHTWLQLDPVSEWWFLKYLRIAQIKSMYNLFFKTCVSCTLKKEDYLMNLVLHYWLFINYLIGNTSTKHQLMLLSQVVVLTQGWSKKLLGLQPSSSWVGRSCCSTSYTIQQVTLPLSSVMAGSWLGISFSITSSLYITLRTWEQLLFQKKPYSTKLLKQYRHHGGEVAVLSPPIYLACGRYSI